MSWCRAAALVQILFTIALERAMKPIPDKAEVALEYPDKVYIGSFERSSDFDAHLDEIGIALTLHHGGDENARKSVRLHIHYALFAEMLGDLAKSAAKGFVPESHRLALVRAAADLAAALRAVPQGETHAGRRAEQADEMSAAEEVALLHILE
jgi:hypothetical protein